MVQRVFLHPGPPKTGTTYLQSLLYANVDSLKTQGLLMVGSQAQHFNAANELLGVTSRRGTKVPEGAWGRVCEQVREYDGNALMSCERYSLLRAPQLQQVMASFADRELHVVLTLRDVAAVLPARWQEALKNGSSTTWADFCEDVATNPASMRRVSRAHSTLRLWSEVLPAERIHVVTVPASTAPRTLLLERFCEVIGVETGKLDTLEAPRSNPSLDLVGAEVVRRLNASGSDLSPAAHHYEVKAFLAARVLTRTRRGDKPALTKAAFDAARRETRRVVRRIEQERISVCGDLAELDVVEPPSQADVIPELDDQAVLDAAIEALGALADRSGRRGRRISALKRGLPDPKDGQLPRRRRRLPGHRWR